MKIVIIKYNAGNVYSVAAALKRIGYSSVISSDLEEIKSADKIIFPGVGEASSAMKFISKIGLDRIISELKQPFLGVCLGLQLLCDYSEERDTKCLGVFNERVKLFSGNEKVPHMGWNSISFNEHKLFTDVKNGSFVYFVHSYYAGLNKYTIAETNYIQPFSAALHKDNFYALQFHPEKSGLVGEQILKNFIELI
ncbi:MAG: imidazole glycerol phosphate synthase subunit HisH [Bacteroidetes bacterium]|nr:imidazole glycerol phosphate synthase subunit HisH [Bacteroidota bacterium]MBU1113803.1 imidazole glycerol phosphate synthase subunit HisH [Bacteroidota bacterium]MBU1799611.1 imidazole glycerol phosphate synthase subunit HisH [Bacteroidota bacterium]